MDDPVRHGRDQINVVTDHQETAGEPRQEGAQPGDGVRVEVVGRFVEQQRVLLGEEDSRQLHPSALPAGQFAEPLSQYPVGQPDACGHLCGAGLGLDLEDVELVLRPGVGAHGPVPLGVEPGFGHGGLRGAHRGRDPVQATGGQDPVHDRLVLVGSAGVLCEVPDRSGRLDGPGGGPQLTRHRAHERRLARSVAPDEGDPVAAGDVEVDVRQQ
ncbi:hypothetical protein SANTM175S_02194 [Streptomyces antimycoticus]